MIFKKGLLLALLVIWNFQIQEASGFLILLKAFAVSVALISGITGVGLMFGGVWQRSGEGAIFLHKLNNLKVNEEVYYNIYDRSVFKTVEAISLLNRSTSTLYEKVTNGP